MSQLKSGCLVVAATLATTLGFGGNGSALAGTGILDIRIEKVLAGANGDSKIQFIEILMQDGSQDLWGPQGNETESRTILTFHDATGLEVSRYEFAADAPAGTVDGNGHFSVLVATSEFENATGGITPDFTMPPSLMGVDGMVCFRQNPDNLAGDSVNLCLSYGSYVGGLPPDAPDFEPDGCGMKLDNGFPLLELPIASNVDVMGLIRGANDGPDVSFGCYVMNGGNADFFITPAVARNSGGDLSALVFADIADQGRTLFEEETFYGNGRTCSSCHVEQFSFGLPPEHIAARFAAFDPMVPGSDPLFVNESNDQPLLADLENTCLMRQGNLRGLSLENVNGFDMDPGFRATPHLLNIGLTAPYGLSGSLEDLEGFAVGAIRQHLPKTLTRNSDPIVGPLDFRVPTIFEEVAMAVFQIEASQFPLAGMLGMDIGIAPKASFTSVDRDTFLNAMIAKYEADFPRANSANIAAGRALYFGELTGQCFRCHDGQALDTADGSLGVEDSFDVVSSAGFPANADDGCSGGIGDPDPELPPADDGRAFNTSPMIGIAKTAPFFHDNSAATLRDAVDHYTSGRFRNSPAGVLLNSMIGQDITLTDDDIDRIVDFLNAVSFVPEPSVGLLQIAAIATLGVLRRRRR